MDTHKHLQELLARAKAADASGHSASAFELFQRVLALDSSKESAAYRAAINLLEVGRISDAERFINKLGAAPKGKLWLIHLLLGRVRTAQSRPAEAQVHFSKARDLNPDTTEPAVFLANCLYRQENFHAAAEVLLNALDASGDLDEVYLNLGLIKRAQADYHGAKFYLLKALEITPDCREAKKVLADVESCLKSSP